MSVDQDATASGESRHSSEAPYPSQRYAWFVVSVLLVLYIFSFMDRQILTLLVGPIKADLGLSDLQMSYLMGISFAVFYALFGQVSSTRIPTRSTEHTTTAHWESRQGGGPTLKVKR